MSLNEDTVVLVADDEPSTLALVSAHLRTKGFKVIEASDGDQAWQMAHEYLPDVVVLDVMMPGMSGWEVCRKIREAVSLAHTGVVMLTGIGENLNELTSPLYGADAHLDKPFEFATLDEKIQETLDIRRAESAESEPPEESSEESEEGSEDSSDESSDATDDDEPASGVTTSTKPVDDPEEEAEEKNAASKKKATPKKATPKKKPAKKKVTKKPAKKKVTKKPAKKAAKKAAKKK